jgi:hypothetical protein
MSASAAAAAAACSWASDCGMSRCSTACRRRRRRVASGMFGCAASGRGGAGRGLSLGGTRIRRSVT